MVVTIRKILLLGTIAFFGVLTNARADDIQWTVAGGPNPIPNNGNTYYINTTENITTTVTNNGVLEIRSGADVTITGGSGQLTNTLSIIISGGTLNVTSSAYLYQDSTSATIVMNSGTINLNSAYFTILDGSFTMNGGMFTTGGSGQIENIANSGDSYFNINGGRLSLSATSDIYNGQGGGTNTGYFVVHGGTFLWDGEFINGYNPSSYGHLEISQNATLIIDQNATLTKEGTDTYDVFGMTDFSVSGGTTTIPSGQTMTLPEAAKYNVAPGSILLNQSSSSIDITGDMYVHGTLNNGDGSNAGTINVNYKGRLIIPGGTVENGHASSAINVETGGSLYNYYGTLEAGLGDMTVKAGGKFSNARGNIPEATLNVGSLFFESDEITLDSNLDIDYTWTITTKAVIRGNGHSVTLGAFGEIVAYGPDASILFDDVILKDVSGYKIRCTDNTTTLSIKNVTWQQDANYSFTMGQIHVAGDMLIAGNGQTFSYKSDQTSTLASGATITLNQATLEYDTASSNLFSMADASSQINLVNGTILATQNCELSNGTLVVTRKGLLQGTGQLNLSGLDNIKAYGSLSQIGNVFI